MHGCGCARSELGANDLGAFARADSTALAERADLATS
jgi:hypothetical protein